MIILAIVAVVPEVASPQESPSTAPGDPGAARQGVKSKQAELASEIDVLQADEAQLRAALADLEANVASAQAQVADADRNVALARDEAARAAEQAEAAADWYDVVREAVSRMAVESYIAPPGEVDLEVLDSVDSATDEVLKKVFLESRSGRDADLLDELRQARFEMESNRDRAAAAEAAAEASSAAVEAKLTQLEVARAQQEGLVRGIGDRLEARLAEADALAAIDAQLAEQIRAQELALVASLNLPPAATPAVVANPPTTPGTEPPGSTTSTTAAPGTPTTTTKPGATSTTTKPPSPTTTPTTKPPSPTTTPTTKPPSPTTTRPGGGIVIVGVRGLWVNEKIAADLEKMLAAAEADGIVLRGGGYRDPESQIALRKAHCGPTYYDIWEKPASECHPPTARPGTSMHEQGLAIDFTWNGTVITSRSSPAFVWLAAHANSYGFYNLPSEPWHWSVNGH